MEVSSNPTVVFSDIWRFATQEPARTARYVSETFDSDAEVVAYGALHVMASRGLASLCGEARETGGHSSPNRATVLQDSSVRTIPSVFAARGFFGTDLPSRLPR